MSSAAISSFRSLKDLNASIPDILASPSDGGTLDAIVVRPERGERVMVHSVALSNREGVHGDHWAKGCWMSTEAGEPHPDVQICIMNSRCIRAIAGEIENWALAGDNLFLDLDLTPDNLPPGTLIGLGTAELVITEVPHHGCQAFIDRYGRDACIFVNTGNGKKLRLRGIYARVVKDGVVAVGDVARKLTAAPAPDVRSA